MNPVAKQKYIFMLRCLISLCQKPDLNSHRENFKGFMGLTIHLHFNICPTVEDTQLWSEKVSCIVSVLNSVSQGTSDYLQLLLSINCSFPMPGSLGFHKLLVQMPCAQWMCGRVQEQMTSCISGCIPKLGARTAFGGLGFLGFCVWKHCSDIRLWLSLRKCFVPFFFFFPLRVA